MVIDENFSLVIFTGCRTAPNLDDVVLAFKQLGIHIHELQDYMQQVEACPTIKPIPRVPIPKEQLCLMDFSGEDFLPALIDVSIKEEEKDVEDEKLEGENEEILDGEFFVILLWSNSIFLYISLDI